SSPRARPQGRSSKRKSGAVRKPVKRRRETYGDDSDIEPDSDEIEEDEEEEASFAESDADEEFATSAKTGRRVRAAARKPVKYEEEPSDVELADEDSDRDSLQPSPAARSRQAAGLKKRSLMVKLKLPSMAEGGRALRPRTGSKSLTKREPTPQEYRGMAMRRSSRISHDDQEPLVALTDSGRHETITRPGTATPEPPSRRPTRGSKGLKKPPSAIMEASQEDSQQLQSQTQGEDLLSQLNQAATHTRLEVDPTSPEAAAQAENDDDDDIRMERVDEDEVVVQESMDDDDEDDGPIAGAGRSLRPRRKASTPPTSQPARGSQIADEAADLEEDHRRNKRTRKGPATRSEIAFEPNLRNRSNRPDYRILRPELLLPMEDDDAPAAPSGTPQRNRRGGGGGVYRSLFSTYGPFGGAGGPAPVFGGPDGAAAAGGVDSDSSDDDARGGQQGVGGAVGMTPTSAFPKPYVPQTHSNDPIQGPGGGPPGLGKVKDKRALADADPLGVDTNVTFDGVGGLDNHINQLKEMVALPLLYPEVFQRFHVTPPRGVLFHGPPGTGKTLLARALASSVSSHGKKVTFYMRKGADALSKWVGEAERQLRLLFEEARKNQPSIIFFDEIDGLAPVRSSKQEQIHASIVATLLALMDGMDGRGQVIVIGATNRPDSVDPALRRPGRFDREFYFPLPDEKARRAIIDIHTKGWEPPLQPAFKDQLAEITRGYGGADLRALCTEAALNAVQGTYPQIYASDKKLVIDASTIKVLAKDFMISVNKIVPSSERSASSGAAPLKKDVEPLLRRPLQELTDRMNEAIPRKRKATALEEAMYDDRDDELGFERETMQRQFESSRIFRPRLLIHGLQGMGQQYLGAALLGKLEGIHVQSFDMATLMKDSTRSPEAAVIQLFEEVKRHKPSVIYIPDIDLWHQTMSDATIRTFTGLLRSLPPTEPVLLLGIVNKDLTNKTQVTRSDRKMMQDLFAYSGKNRYMLVRPTDPERREFFNAVIDLISKPPSEFPEQETRKRRKLAELPVAQAQEEPKRGPTKDEQKAQKKKDQLTLNMLKISIQPVMDQIKRVHKKFRTPIVDEAAITYLYDEQNPDLVTTDLSEEQRQQQQLFRPYELDKDEKGVAGLREVASGKFYYNLEIVTIEKRLSNGYYKRPKDFTADIKRLAKDAKTSGDQDRTLKANEMLANVEVDMAMLETQQAALVAECEAVYERELEREREQVRKMREAERAGLDVPRIVPNVPPPNASKTTTETSGPVMLGQEVPGRPALFPITPSRMPAGGPSPNSNPWSTTNGSHPSHQTNGSTVPSRPQEDSEMLDSQHEVFEQQQQQSQRDPHITSSQQNTQGQRSQKSAHTQIAQGSQLDQYHNSASTTTSGQKTSDRSGRSSDPYSQYSNGVHNNHPNFNTFTPAVGGSQLPDTQPQEEAPAFEPSQPSQSSQNMPPPAAPSQNHRQASIHSILNNAEDAAPTTTTTANKTAAAMSRIILDQADLALLHGFLVRYSSGMSVEQLEQVNASLMDVVWRLRGDWNRNHVLHAVKEAFNETVKDIENCQEIKPPSQEDDDA
ncbi:hypothetical protein BAUCODRAFT_73927, partial [Baudoinia panamericana UAMH 10762]